MRTVSKFVALSLLFSSPVWSENDPESRVSLLECKMKAARDDTVYECRSGARFASGRPFLNSYGLWVTGNVLYWTAYEGGTDFVYTSTDSSTALILGRTFPLQFEWDVGYRLGVGWTTPSDNMEMAAIFTRFEPDANGSANAPVGGRLASMQVSDVTSAQAAFENVCLEYNTIDFEFGRSYFLSRHFYLRPHFGSRTVWIEQNGDFQFTSPGVTTTGHLRDDYIGAGLRLGTDSKWFFARHWNLFLGASSSAVYGKNKAELATNRPGIYGSDNEAATRRVAIAAQTQLGLGWETNFACDSNQLAINLGYELNYWWGVNQLPAFERVLSSPYGMRRSEDLAFHGLTVDIQLAF